MGKSLTKADFGKIYRILPDSTVWCISIQTWVKFVDESYVRVNATGVSGAVFFGDLIDKDGYVRAEIEVGRTSLDAEFKPYDSLEEMQKAVHKVFWFDPIFGGEKDDSEDSGEER